MASAEITGNKLKEYDGTLPDDHYVKSDVWEVKGENITFYLHEGQKKALQCKRKFVAVIAGTQGGKTVFGPCWLLLEMIKCGPGDYGVVSPTYSLMQKKTLKEFRRLFEHALKYGYYNKSEKTFVFNARGKRQLWGRTDTEASVIFGYAENPDSLESMTMKAVWCDEAGQRAFKLDSFYALRRRLSIYDGRMLITTTPYDLGWLKTKIWDEWMKGNEEIDVVSFASTMNPTFSKEEFEQAKKALPEWKFKLFYEAIFTKPSGAIYDIFDSRKHKVKRFPIPQHWKTAWGIDFGQTNFACVKIAENPDYDPDGDRMDPMNRRYYIYLTYRAGNKSIREHIRSLRKKNAGHLGEPVCFGGAPSENIWRQKMTLEGLPCHQPTVGKLEEGIDDVYGLFATGELAVFDDLDKIEWELENYSREVGEDDQPTEKIEKKGTFHRLDALRYIGSQLARVPSVINHARTRTRDEDEREFLELGTEARELGIFRTRDDFDPWERRPYDPDEHHERNDAI